MGKVGNEANFFICKVLLLRVQYGVGKMKYRDVRDAQRGGDDVVTPQPQSRYVLPRPTIYL